MERVTELGPGFAPRDPPDADLAAYVSRSISWDVYTAVARVVLHAPLEVMADRISPAAGVLTPIDAGRCRLTTGARSVETLAAWIGMLGVDFEVEEPPALVEQLRVVGTRYLRAAEAARCRAESAASSPGFS